MNELSFVFFGTGAIARTVAHELDAAGYRPALVVTAPDAKKGRGLLSSASAVALWTAELGIPTLKPEKIDDDFLDVLRSADYELFIVSDYGTIVPKALIDIPPKGCLNMHPSLLPHLRGPSPIRSAILNDERETGVTIMLLDEQMDHGPIIAQRKVAVPMWPPRGSELDALLAREGGRLLADILPMWMRGEIEPQQQNHDVATYTKKFKKEDGEIDLAGDAYANLLKIRAFEGWPGTYTYVERGGKKVRLKILDAHIEGARLILDSIVPEGKRAMPYADFEDAREA